MRIALFLLLLLPLAALGHDAYLAYWVNGEPDLSREFKFSDLGWLWINYAPDSYEFMYDGIERAFWDVFISPVLRMTAALAALVPALVLFSVMFASKLLEKGVLQPLLLLQRKKVKLPKRGGGEGFTFGDGRKTRRFEYKRKK